MKTVLVLGGAGYVGSHTVKDLIKNDYRCIVVDNLVYGHRDAVLTDDFIELDLSDKEGIEKVFAQHPIDGVIHFAAYAHVGESVDDPAKYYYNNVVNTLNVLEAMRKNNIKYLVFSSTCATYGNPMYIPIDEDHPQNPINPYGRTKLMNEQILFDYEKAYGLKYMALRYFNVAGCDSEGQLGERHDPETHLIPLVLDVASEKRDFVTVFGADYDTSDGTCIRDYIHVEDIAKAHRLALEKLWENKESHCINLGTGKGTSVKEIIAAVEKVVEKKIPVKYEERRVGDPGVLFAANQKAEDILGWIPTYTDINEIIKTAWRLRGKND